MVMEKERKFKAGIDKDDCRKNRAAQKVQLRKNAKEEGMQKRRNMVADAEIVVEEAAATGGSSVADYAQTVMQFVQRNGPHEEAEQCLDAVVHLRKQLSIAHKPPIDEVIGTGAVPCLVMLLGHPMSKMQFEAAWCLTNIASGTSEQCQAIVGHNAVPALVGLVRSDNLEVSEQAVWALGNIAGDCPRLRDLVLEAGMLEPLFALIETTAAQGKMAALRNAVWSLSNMVRGKPPPAWDKVACTVPLLTRLLTIDDAEVHSDVCWAFSYLADGDNQSIDAIALAGATPGLVKMLNCGDMKVVTPAMRALSNMLTGSDKATQTVIDSGFLNFLAPIFRSPKMQLRKEVCWALSNITAGTPAQIDEVMRTNLLQLVIDRLSSDEFDVQKEATWVLANVMHGFKSENSLHSANRVRTLVQMGCLPPMINMLEKNDAATQDLVLGAMSNLLAAGEELGKAKGDNEFVKAFDEAEGIDKLEALQEHKNESIYEKAIAILETYFGEDEDEDENLAPNAANGGFAFGMQQSAGLAPAGQQPAFAF